uniref:Uncharacterized protein n=1 Tax=Trypanosoma vivax (strain Y486) TaxID=1055687 RepID=G0U5W8_TRYVY|nr:hypothetical protein TVY486_1003220 [Trypanosoma vivax Y486]
MLTPPHDKPSRLVVLLFFSLTIALLPSHRTLSPSLWHISKANAQRQGSAFAAVFLSHPLYYYHRLTPFPHITQTSYVFSSTLYFSLSLNRNPISTILRRT